MLAMKFSGHFTETVNFSQSDSLCIQDVIGEFLEGRIQKILIVELRAQPHFITVFLELSMPFLKKLVGCLFNQEICLVDIHN